MPTYDYKCTVCSERFEVEQSIHDDALTTLAGDDHEHQLKKVFSPVGIAFKGDGFYRNDSRGGSAKGGGSSTESSSTSASSDSSSTTSESSSTNGTNGSSSSSSSSSTADASS